MEEGKQQQKRQVKVVENNQTVLDNIEKIKDGMKSIVYATSDGQKIELFSPDGTYIGPQINVKVIEQI